MWEAARATSAAPTFFKPLTVGGQQFVDGGLVSNNPVYEMESEAMDIWGATTGDLKPLIKCFISIGSEPYNQNPETWSTNPLAQHLDAVTDAANTTACKFSARWAKLYDPDRYFRFTINGVSESINLENFQASTRLRLRPEVPGRLEACALNLRLKESKHHVPRLR